MSRLEQARSTDMLVAADTHVVQRRRIRLERRTPAYWQVTLDNPPFNIFGPETIPGLSAVIWAVESDPMVKVVVFDSSVPGFFLTHYDFVPELAASTSAAIDRCITLQAQARIYWTMVWGRVVRSEMLLHIATLRLAADPKRWSIPSSNSVVCAVLL